MTRARSAIATALVCAAAFSGQVVRKRKSSSSRSTLLGRPLRARRLGHRGRHDRLFQLLNARDPGVNGVRITWEKCETEYRNDRASSATSAQEQRPHRATLIHPLPPASPTR